MTKLKQQATDRGRSLRQLLNILSATVPEFGALVSGANPKRIEPVLRRTRVAPRWRSWPAMYCNVYN